MLQTARLKRTFMALLSLAATIAIFATGASAQPLAERVPADTMLYFGWRGTADLGPGYPKSELKALVDDSHVREVFADSMPRVAADLQRLAGPNGKPAIDALNAIAPAIWKYPSAMSVSVAFVGKSVKPHIALYCKAGADALNLQHTIDDLIAQAGPAPLPIHTAVVDDVVVLAIGYDDPAQAIVSGENADAKPLSAKPEFVNALAKCGDAPGSAVFTMYLDVASVLTFADQAIEQSNDQQVVAMWPKVRDELGIGGFHRVMVTAGFDGKMWADRAFIEAPMPRTGLMGMFDAPPLTDAVLKVVPSDATAFATTSFNLAKFITDARDITARINPDAGAKFDQGLGIVQMYVGRNLVRDVLAPLGSSWVSYQDPTVAGPGFASITLVNKLADPAKAMQGLNAVAIAINNTVNGFLRPRNMELTFRQAKIDGLTINYLASPLIAPAWTIKDGLLYVGMYPQTVAAAANRGSGGKSILENANFVATRALLGNVPTQSLQFADLPRLAPQGYSSLLLASRLLLGAADIFGGQVPEPVVPTLDVLMKHITPTGAVAWNDEQGFYAKGISPFPGAEILGSGGSDGLIYVLSGIGQAIGAAAPAMNHSVVHVDNHQVESQKNLRQLGMATMIYASENRGKLPPSFAVALEQAKLGSNGEKATHSPFAASVESMDDYTYLGRDGLKMSSFKNAATTMIAYDNVALAAGSGTAALFLDGHTEWVDAQHFETLLADAKAKGLGGGL